MTEKPNHALQQMVQLVTVARFPLPNLCGFVLSCEAKMRPAAAVSVAVQLDAMPFAT